MSASKILVVLPTLGDRLDTLAETLASVETQRADVDLTLVMVLPPEAAEARELGRAHGAVLVDDRRRGISAAINHALATRTTESYYAWVGDDDLFRPGGLRTLRDLLDRNPRAVLSFGGCDYIDPEGRTIVVSNGGALAAGIISWGPDLIPHIGTMIRLDALEAIGGFDVSLKFAMDLDALLSLRRRGKFVWTREVVSAFRWHPESLTVSNRARSGAEAERVKRKHLPVALRPISPLWSIPIRWASAIAARRLNARALRLRDGS